MTMFKVGDKVRSIFHRDLVGTVIRIKDFDGDAMLLVDYPPEEIKRATYGCDGICINAAVEYKRRTWEFCDEFAVLVP